MKSNVINLAFRGCTAALATLAMTAMVSTANAQSVPPLTPSIPGSSNQISNGTYSGTTVSGWTVPAGSYNFIYTAGDTAATSSFGADDVTLKSNGFTGGVSTFIGLDSDYPTGTSGSISTTVSGLQTGLLTVNFLYAVDQQTGFDGAFDTTLKVSLGSQTDNITLAHQWSATDSATPAANVTWYLGTAIFNVTNPADDVLMFAATSSSSANLPSFLLLAAPATVQTQSAPTVPEPGSLALLSTGLLGLGGFVRSRFGKKS